MVHSFSVGLRNFIPTGLSLHLIQGVQIIASVPFHVFITSFGITHEQIQGVPFYGMYLPHRTTHFSSEIHILPGRGPMNFSSQGN